jgi:hypothetical protein
MRRLLAAWVLAVLVAGCGPEEKKKPADLPKSEPIPMFDKKAPRGSKKGPGAG